MTIPRFHLFELEDFPWFPIIIRGDPGVGLDTVHPPVRWTRLLFTYLIPLVPLTCFWDGFVSQLRAYTPDELRELAESLGEGGYQWDAGKVKLDGSPAHLTYLIGRPVRFD